MSADKFSMKFFFLQFHDKATESLYKDHIIDRTLLWCRIAWGLVIFLGGSFGILDHQVFGDKAEIVLLCCLLYTIFF